MTSGEIILHCAITETDLTTGLNVFSFVESRLDNQERNLQDVFQFWCEQYQLVDMRTIKPTELIWAPWCFNKGKQPSSEPLIDNSWENWKTYFKLNFRNLFFMKSVRKTGQNLDLYDERDSRHRSSVAYASVSKIVFFLCSKQFSIFSNGNSTDLNFTDQSRTPTYVIL